MPSVTRKPRRWFLSLLSLLSGAGLACGSNRGDLRKSNEPPTAAGSASAHHSPDSPGNLIELFGWGAKVGESDPLGALMKVHNRRYPNDRMINASAELSGIARKTLHERLWRGEPPDTFQANVGQDLMKWVVVNGGDAAESRLLPLSDELPNAAELSQNLPKAILELLSFDGKLYAVPINVQRINSVFYNKKLFVENGLSEPKTIAELYVVGEKLKRKGIPLFGLGTREPWTLTLFIFESLLVSREGLDFYRDYFRGRYQWDDPRLRATLEEALKLLEYANPNHPSLTWVQSVELVARGRAAMTVIGDWARVSLGVMGMRLGVDYDEAPFPGTENALIFTADTFSLPRGSKNKDGTIRLLSTMASYDGQLAMNDARNALPARIDVIRKMDPVLKQKHQLLERNALAVAFSGLLPDKFGEDLCQATAEMAAMRDLEPVMLTLKSRYPLLH